MTSSRHLPEILLIQIVATYLVVLGHSYPFVSPVPDWLVQTQVFIYCFHMPLFVWISGYLLAYTQQSLRNSSLAFMRKRFLKLLIPYIVLSLVAIVPKYLLQSYLNDSVALDSYSIVRTFLCPRENVWGHFWFLPMIFILGVVGLWLDKLFRLLKWDKLGWTLTTVVLFAIYCYAGQCQLCRWFGFDDLISFGWLYAFGTLCASFKILSISKLPPPSILRGLFLIITALAISVAMFVWNRANILPQSITNAAIALLMIYSLTLTCIYMSRKISLDKSAIYAQTFTIFILSWPFQAVANVLAERLLHLPYYAVMPIQFIVGIFTPMLLIWLIDKIESKYKFHWISFCLGK